MEITIGRDAVTSKLSITIDKKTQLVGEPKSVPMSVSRQHCAITISDVGKMKIKNLNPGNTTYVNGVAIMSKNLTRDDSLELGEDKYRIDWGIIDQTLPKEADIRPLNDVWETYNSGTKAVAQSTQQFQVVRGIVPVFTMSAVLIGYLSGGRGGPFYLIYALVIALTVFFSIKAWRDIARNDERREEIKKQFTQDYCCPLCGYFFGFTEYRILKKNMDNCPKSKTKLRK